MKRLVLLRHAKAVSKNTPDDAGRVLAARGRSDMALVAAALADAGIRPDVALVSPAARTRETWALAGQPDVPVRFEPAIYEASVRTLLGLVHAAPPAAGTVAMVGHNPGFEELAATLADRKGRPQLRDGMPTAAVAVLDFEVERWTDVAPEKGRLVQFVTPDDLGGGPDA